MTLVFQGFFDQPALAGLRALCEAPARSGKKARVPVGAGTQVETNLADEIL